MDSFNDPTLRRILESQRETQELLQQAHEAQELLKQAREAQELLKQARETQEIHKQWREAQQFNWLLEEFRQTQSVREELTAQSALRQLLEHQSSSLAEAYRFGATEQLLRASFAPLPPLEYFKRSAVGELLLRSYAGLNASIVAAPLIGEVEFSSDDDGTDLDNDDVEQQLVDVLPAEAIEQLKRADFVPFSVLAKVFERPDALYEMEPRHFEEFIAELLVRLGLENVTLTPERADGGRDVLGTKSVLNIPLFFAFECKRYTKKNAVGVETARALLGTISHEGTRADRGVLVTTSRLTTPARKFIMTSPKLAAKEFDDVIDWVTRAREGGPTTFL